jgi:hypothetical protein
MHCLGSAGRCFIYSGVLLSYSMNEFNFISRVWRRDYVNSGRTTKIFYNLSSLAVVAAKNGNGIVVLRKKKEGLLWVF